jgi:Fe-S-cluster containining protein
VLARSRAIGYKKFMTHKAPHPDPHHHTVRAPIEDSRDAKDLSASENADLCGGCVKCCTYITVEIDAPRAAWEYDQWIWALHHEGIEVYVERPERWFLHVEAGCRKLNDAGRCSIYGRHPVLCREYDPRACERRLPLADVRAWFHDGEEFERWIQAARPAHWQRLMDYRRDQPQAPPIADARADRAAAGTLIPLAALTFAATGLTGSKPTAAGASAPARRRLR